MSAPDLEQHFLAFRASGDPRAIAAVYDEVAPELLLVAAHLGERGGNAEDLVQATFLAAMEQSGAFEPGRPLMPWLIGILVNQARSERRRRDRRPDSERLVVADPPDPLRAAEDAEFIDELHRKLQSLPDYYRQVLTLRFIHGLAPLEIAHSLGLSPDTVKTRLRRGQDLLRKALPASFAASLAGLVSAGPGLPAVRERILARAEELLAARAASTKAAAAVSGSNLVTPVAIAAVLLVSAAVALLPLGSGPAAPPQPVPAPVAAKSGSPDPAPPTDSARRDLPAAAPAAESTTLQLAVRFADGSPAAGARVALGAVGAPDPLLTERFATASAEGLVDLDGLAPGAWQVRALRGGAATLQLSPGATAAELRIPDGVDVELRVTGKGGRPLAGAVVLLSPEGFLDEGTPVAHTGPAGTVALRSVAPGRSLHVLAEGYAASPLQLVRPSMTIDLAGSGSRFAVTGRVTDEGGEPVPGALVQIGRRLPHLDFADAALGPESRRPPVQLRTGDDGCFRREGLTVHDRKVEVYVRAAGFGLYRQVLDFGRGNQVHAAVTLGAARRLAGVVRGAGGRPAGGVRVTALDRAVEDQAFAPRWATIVSFTGADGRYVLTGLPAGEVQLQALAADGRRAAGTLAARTRFEPDLLTWDPQLEAMGAIRGRVVDTAGLPVAGLQVDALVPKGRTRPPATTTGADGAFVVDGCAPGEHALWLVDPQSPWSGAVASCSGARPDGEEITLVVDPDRVPTAAITGRVVDAAGQPVEARLALRSLRVGAGHAMSDPHTGRFRFDRVPALAVGYDIYVHLRRDYWTRVEVAGMEPGRTLDLGDLTAHPAGGIELVVQHRDGRVVDKARVMIHHPNGLLAEQCPIGEGRGVNDVLAPGEYVLHLVGPGLAPTATRCRVRSGARTRIELLAAPGLPRQFTFAHPDDGWDLRLELTWCDPQGRPRWRERVQLKHTDPVLRRQLAPGTHVLRARSHSGHRAEIRFEVGGEDTPPIAVVFDQARGPQRTR